MQLVVVARWLVVPWLVAVNGISFGFFKSGSASLFGCQAGLEKLPSFSW